MVKNSHILLDTCVVSNLQSKEKGLAVETEKLIEDLKEKANDFYFSCFTRYELLRGANNSTKQKMEEFLKTSKEIGCSDERLGRAIYLYSGYKSNKDICSRLNSISDVDVFNGALVFTEEKPLLLTADYNDFPRPFFLERECRRIEFRKRGKNKVSIYYYLLEANLEEF